MIARGARLWKMYAGFHGKLTWLPPSRNERPLDFDHSRWNKTRR